MPLPNYGSSKKSIPVLDPRGAVANAWSSPSRPAPSEEAIGHHEMTEGERARTVLGNNRLAVLSVSGPQGSPPLGFVVPYAVGQDGFPLLGIRPGIEQVADVRPGVGASLAVAETPLSASTAGIAGGVTIVGTLDHIPPGEWFDEAISDYTRNQPSDANAIKRGEGRLYALQPKGMLVSVGRGAIVDLSIEDYMAASSDPLAAVAPGLVTHLSNDQGGSLVLLSRAFGGQPAASSASLAGIDQYGMDLLVTTPHGRESVRLNFSHPVSTPEEVRRELTVMARGARFKLGVG